VERFVQAGGGVLAAFGDRADPADWNRLGWRQGRGWLPARLLEPAGDDDPEAAPRPKVAEFRHPALDLFRDPLPGGLNTAVFPRRTPSRPAASRPATTPSAPTRGSSSSRPGTTPTGRSSATCSAASNSCPPRRS